MSDPAQNAQRIASGGDLDLIAAQILKVLCQARERLELYRDKRKLEGEKLNLDLRSRPQIRTERILGDVFEKVFEEGDLSAFGKSVVEYLGKDAPNHRDLVLPRLNIIGDSKAMDTFRSLSESYHPFYIFSFIDL